MTTVDDDDGGAPGPGFVRATPEMLAQQRAEALAQFEHEAKRWLMLEVGLTEAQALSYLARIMKFAVEKFDETSRPFAEKVLAKFERDGGAVH